MINTSIHEALPVSFLEALQYQLQIISCQNPEGLVSKFGFYTGRFDKDGRDSISKFTEGLETLLNDELLRIRLGEEGRVWVESHHTNLNFISIFDKILKQVLTKNIEQINEFPEPFGLPLEIYRYYVATQEIKAFVLPDDLFILLDEDQFASEYFEGYSVFPFTEHEGKYGGPPADDLIAIYELEKLHKAGAQYLVVAWPAFWWLNYYKEWHQYLCSNFKCILENERMVIFDLRQNLPGNSPEATSLKLKT